MPSGVADDVADAILDATLGASADTGIFGATLYLDLLTTEATDDNGTDAVSWGQGRTAVTTTDATSWPPAADRVKTSAVIPLPANASGDTLTVVAFAWYTAPTGGTYKGGGPIPDGSLDIPDGVAPQITVFLSSPPPS